MAPLVVFAVDSAIRSFEPPARPDVAESSSVGMGSNAERMEALSSAFTDVDRVFVISTAAAPADIGKVATVVAAKETVTKPSGAEAGAKSNAKSTDAAGKDMVQHENGTTADQHKDEPEAGEPAGNDGSDLDSESEAKLVATTTEAFKDNPKALVAVMRRMYGSKASDSQPLRAVGRSKPIEPFYGKPDELGKVAKDWLSSIEIYLDSVNEKEPVRLVVTYLRCDAQTWWIQGGKEQVGLTASFAEFVEVFLARFVKPGDSRKARHELAKMQQDDMSVETFAAKFRGCADRIAFNKIGTAVDSTCKS